jgi:hypothetical protein
MQIVAVANILPADHLNRCSLDPAEAFRNTSSSMWWLTGLTLPPAFGSCIVFVLSLLVSSQAILDLTKRTGRSLLRGKGIRDLPVPANQTEQEHISIIKQANPFYDLANLGEFLSKSGYHSYSNITNCEPRSRWPIIGTAGYLSV